MLATNVKLLVIDDDAALRMSFSEILAGCKYQVRSAEDGFSALVEIRKDMPDIILSDLNMPGMSGFELLSVVRRRFPSIQSIAMSGAFSGEGVPPGVAADAFYEKGTSIGALLQIIKVMADAERPTPMQSSSMLAPIWIPKSGRDPSGEAYVMISCPECLRTFPRVLDEAVSLTHETSCVYCSSLILYAIVQASDPLSSQAFQRHPGTGTPTPLCIPDFD